MERADKIAVGGITIVICALGFALLWGIKIFGSTVFGWFVDADGGVGFKPAFFYAICVATFVIVLFALVAGDGLIGELPTVLISFFLLVTFFTFSIAWIF